MRFVALWGALVPLAFVACTLNLRVPKSSVVTCGGDAECPAQQRCSPTLRRCVPAVANQVPSATVSPISRGLQTALVNVRVVDAESDPTTLAVVLIVDEQRVEAGAAVAASLVDLQTSPEGVQHELTLDLATLLGGTGYRSGLRVAVLPRDATGVGAEVSSEPFEFGNDAPVLSDVVVLGSSGTVSVAFSVRDSSADPVDVVGFERVVAPSTTPESIPLVAPHVVDPTQLVGIPSLGARAELAWRTAASGALKSEAVVVSLRVRDSFGAETEFVSAPAVALDNSPALTLSRQTPSERPLGILNFTTELQDPSVPDVERLMLDFYYIVGPPNDQAVRHTMVVDGATSDLAQLGQVPFVWDALSEAQTHAFLPVVSLDISDAAQPAVPALGFVSQLTLEATLFNTSGLRSKVLQLPLGPVGNDAPVASISAVGSAKGDVPISVTVVDTSFDPADLEVQFRVGPSGPFRNAALRLTNVTDLATSPAGITHLALWQSTASQHSDPAVPQGIGNTVAADVTLRVRAIDRAGGVSAGGGTRYFGAWSSSSAQTFNNQSAPRVDGIAFDRLIGSDGSAPVAIRYRLVDAESDPVDVKFEVSFDGGVFEPLPEFPSALGEGTTRLASAPEAGVEHVFVWNPTADRIVSHQSALVRLTATDLRNRTVPLNASQPNDTTVQERLLPRTAQHSFAAPNNVRYVDQPRTKVGNGDLGEAVPQIAVGDISGDGINDVVTSEISGPTTQLYLGQGAAGIGTGELRITDDQWYCSATTGPTVCDGVAFAAMQLVDVSADGLLDLVFANVDGTLSVQQGIGGDCIAAQSCFELPPHAFALSGVVGGLVGLHVGELDSQPGLDLAVLAADGTLFAYSVSLSGVPSAPLTFTLLDSVSVASESNVLNVGDTDGDGDLDFIVSNANEKTLSVVVNDLGSSVPTLSVVKTLTLDAAFGAQQSAVLEIDGNGIVDLAAATAGKLHLFLGVGAPEYFVPFKTVSSSTAMANSFAVADINDDGNDDIVLTEQDAGSILPGVFALLGRGRALSSPQPLIFGLDRAVGARMVDLNSDPLLDVVYINDDQVNFGTPNILHSLRTSQLLQGNAGLAHLSPPSHIAVDTGTGVIASEVASADFDGDGTADLAISQAPLGLLIKRGIGWGGFGSGSFEDGQLLDGDSNILSWAIADLNQDGRSDLVYLRHDGVSSAVVSAAANSAGAFTEAQVIAVTANRMWLADINNDQIKDVLLGRPATAGILVYLGNGSNGMGDGTFSAGTTIATPSQGVGSLVSGDFDGDRVTDLIYQRTTGFAANSAYFAKGAGDGTFAASTVVAGVTLATYATAVDWNRDGVLDLVSSGPVNLLNVRPVVTHLGRKDAGTGRANATFDPGMTQAGMPGVVTPGPVHVADYDQDGQLDLVAFTRDRAIVLWMRGNTDGTFAPASTLMEAAGLEPHWFCQADFNGDGMSDWAITHAQAGLLSVFYGQHQQHQSFAQAVRTRSGAKVQTFGSEVVEPDLGMSGLAVDQLGAKSIQFAPVRAPAWSKHYDFWDAIMRAPASAGLQVHRTRALTSAFALDGFESAHREPLPTPDGLGDRLFLFSKFGPLLGSDPFSRAGLSLADGRGLIVRLPLLLGRTHQELLTAASEGRLRVYRYQRRLLRSDDVAEDPLNDPRYLPRVTGPSGPRDLVAYRTTWNTLPFDLDGFASGSGERFTLNLKPLGTRTNDPNDQAKGSIDLLIDQPGMVQAFEVDTP